MAGDVAMKRGISALVGVAALVGCTTVDEQALARLQPGRTTMDQAIAALGRPERNETLPDGSRMLTYIGSHAGMRPANVLPGLVYAWGGWDVTNTEAGLMFGPDGALRFWSWSSNRQPRIRVVGHDVAPHAALDLELKSQDPLLDPEKGAPSNPYSAD